MAPARRFKTPQTLRSSALAVIAACALQPLAAWAQATPPAPAPAPSVPEIDLKLFDKAEVDRSKGCTVALWQSNRNPDSDRYAYLFTEVLAPKTFARQPARIKVGGQVLPLQRVAAGGKTNGYALHEHQLYKLPGDGEYVVLDLTLGELEGEAVEITGGTMTVVMRGKQVFRASVKGGAGCMTAAAPAPPPAPPPAPAAAMVQAKPAAVPQASGTPGMFERYPVRMAQVPKGFVQTVQKKFSCNPDFIARVGITGFQMSEESAIWQIPCDSFAYQSTAVFALVYLPDPNANLTFLTFQGIKGKERTTEPGTLVDPEWDVRSRTVKSVSLGRAAGDCGVFERYRVTPEGRFELMEYREKDSCDGKPTKPETYPLLYRAR